MTAWAWEFVGLMLIVLGLGVAIWGLTTLQRDLFSHYPLPPTKLGRWVRRKFRGPRDIRLELEPVSISVSAQAFGVVTRRKPAESANQRVWNEYWESRLNALEETMGHHREQHRQTIERVAKRSEERWESTNAVVSGLRDRMDRGFAGPNGRGLTLAWCGLGLTLLGTIAQGLGSLLR